jgi:hypothetical protein
MNTPHPLKEIIYSIADGMAVQLRYKDHQGAWVAWVDWQDGMVTPLTVISGNREWRIKQPDIVRYRSTGDGSGYLVPQPASNLKLTFDGETGKLKLAEVI